jgi:hypothetical protein
MDLIALQKKFLKLLNSVFILLSLLITGCATIAGVDSGEEAPFIVIPDDRDIRGEPRSDFRLEGGIFYWKTKNTWHVRFARPYTAPRPIPEGTIFSGNIRVEDGIILDVRRYNVSPPNELRRLRDTISFRFEIKEQVEGFDFIIQPVTSQYCVTSDFRINGIYSPELIRLGEFMHRPDSIPFRICVRSFE